MSSTERDPSPGPLFGDRAVEPVTEGETCPCCGQLTPAALSDREQKVVQIWNHLADRNKLPPIRKPRKYGAKIRTLLRDEPDLDVIRAALTRFVAQDLVRERRYGLGSFIPNRLKYLEAGWEDVHRARARDPLEDAPTQPSTPAPKPEPAAPQIGTEEYAHSQGFETVEDWRVFHGLNL